MHTFDRALVLGPGSHVGTAWTAGLAYGLRRDGVDLGEADLIVGTSAGAIIGALLATGQDPGRLATSARRSAHRVKADPARMGAVFAVLGDRSQEPGEVRRRVGRLALDSTDPQAEEALIAGRAALIGVAAWPQRRLLITAVDATTGEPVVWDRDSGVPLVHAVAASSAFPGAAPPVAIDGRGTWTARCGRAPTPTSRPEPARWSWSSRWRTCFPASHSTSSWRPWGRTPW
ncbi:patatin-like phospholipase family protein [Kitasatospora gansuensis]